MSFVKAFSAIRGEGRTCCLFRINISRKSEHVEQRFGTSRPRLELGGGPLEPDGKERSVLKGQLGAPIDSKVGIRADAQTKKEIRPIVAIPVHKSNLNPKFQ